MGVKLLGKIKIYDIAKKLDLTSKEVLEIAKKLNIEAKSHLSGVEEDEAKKIENEISKKTGKGTNKQAVKDEKLEKKNNSDKNKKEAKKEENTPVIIRREVIISRDEEQEKKKDHSKKPEKKNGNVGFVERKQDKNYNIVYRNKPTKPMTVSELFRTRKKRRKERTRKKGTREK